MLSVKSLSVVLLTAVLAVSVPPPVALADGDPASDFLLSQSTFLSPFDGHVSSSEATRLVGLLAQAAKKGFSLKVAVIVTAYDLGSVPILFRKPKTYAKFLGEEDYYYWKNELLVVMPNGYGIYAARGVPAADKRFVDSLKSPPDAGGIGLVIAAERVVRALAARRGIVLATPSAGGSNGTFTGARLEIAGAVILAGLLAVGIRLGVRRRAAR